MLENQDNNDYNIKVSYTSHLNVAKSHLGFIK